MAATSVKKVENKTARRGFLKWAKSRKGQQTLIILAFTIIPLVLLAAFTYVPFAEMVKFSFYKMKYSTPVDKRVFVGWKNYIEVFRNKDIFSVQLVLFSWRSASELLYGRKLCAFLVCLLTKISSIRRKEITHDLFTRSRTDVSGSTGR